MRNPFRWFLRPRRFLLIVFLVALGLFFGPTRPLRSDNFVFYFPNAHHLMRLELIGHTSYLPLLQVLNMVGTVRGIQEKRKTLRLSFEKSQLEFRQDEKKVRLNKEWLTLSDPMRVSNGQWMAPVSFLTVALPLLIRQAVEYQMGTNRIFIGDVKPASFMTRLDPIADGARLTIQFTDKVSLRTESRNGEWVLILGERPIEPLESSLHFQDPYVSGVRFDDQDGTPKLILTPKTSGLNFYPALAEGGKILIADILRQAPQVARATPSGATPPAPAPSGGAAPAPLAGAAAPPTAGTVETPVVPPGPPLPVVVFDAGHGGADAGARSRDGVLEKDLVAKLAMRIRLAMLATKKDRLVLTRVGDVNPTFDQREAETNAARPSAFISLHAGNLGVVSPRIVVYSYRSPSPPPALPTGGPPLFIPWAEVQSFHLEQSKRLAQALQQQFAEIAGATVDPVVEAPVRALRSIDAPAVAVELGSLAPDADSGPLVNPTFQDQVTNAIVRAIQSFLGGTS